MAVEMLLPVAPLHADQIGGVVADERGHRIILELSLSMTAAFLFACKLPLQAFVWLPLHAFLRSSPRLSGPTVMEARSPNQTKKYCECN